MKTLDIIELRELQEALVRAPELYAQSLKDPNGKIVGHRTFCNIGAQRIAHAFDCHEFDDRTADEDFTLLSQKSDWEEINPQQAHEAANRGEFAVACHYKEPHGHIVTIYPAPQMHHSEEWGIDVPWCANVGIKNEIAPLDGHFPFGMPKYFHWKGPSND